MEGRPVPFSSSTCSCSPWLPSASAFSALLLRHALLPATPCHVAHCPEEIADAGPGDGTSARARGSPGRPFLSLLPATLGANRPVPTPPAAKPAARPVRVVGGANLPRARPAAARPHVARVRQWRQPPPWLVAPTGLAGLGCPRGV